MPFANVKAFVAKNNIYFCEKMGVYYKSYKMVQSSLFE
ncbi:Uncharacterised protein [Chryseobacterium nakagawai]|nr:Uncharacterised protein [Chryseobacterium nakagawai]